MKKFICLLGFILILFVSGCISLPQAIEGNGILIEAFEPDFPQMSSGEPIQLRLKIRNVGAVDAENVKFEIYNVFGTKEGSELICREGNKECKSVEKILAPTKEVPGESKTCIWVCDTSVKIPAGLQVSYNPRVRITYKYRSDVIASITLVSQDEIRTITDSGGSLPNEISKSTRTPILLNLKLKGPVKYWERKEEITFPLSIEVVNVGGGTSCYPNCEEPKDWNKVKLKLVGTPEIILEECDIEKPVILLEGRSRSVPCVGKILKIPKTFGPMQKTIEIQADYEYFIDEGTSVTVMGMG
jgi:hypothetical protein